MPRKGCFFMGDLQLNGTVIDQIAKTFSDTDLRLANSLRTDGKR
jgi:hypothetical protein